MRVLFYFPVVGSKTTVYVAIYSVNASFLHLNLYLYFYFTQYIYWISAGLIKNDRRLIGQDSVKFHRYPGNTYIDFSFLVFSR